MSANYNTVNRTIPLPSDSIEESQLNLIVKKVNTTVLSAEEPKIRNINKIKNERIENVIKRQKLLSSESPSIMQGTRDLTNFRLSYEPANNLSAADARNINLTTSPKAKPSVPKRGGVNRVMI